MNTLWAKAQSEVPLAKGLTFNQSMVKYGDNNGFLSEVLKALKI